MAHNLVDVDTWTASVAVPDDGDAANAASVESGMQDLADRTLYLRNRLPSAAASYQIVVPAFYTQNILSRFSYDIAAAAVPYPVHTDVTSVGGIYCPLYGLPSSGTITSIVAKVNGKMQAGAPHGGLIGTPPELKFIRWASSTAAVTQLAVTPDPHANTNLALYEAPHDISSGVLAESLSTARVYSVFVEGEGGLNAANDNFGVYCFVVTITP